MSPRAGHVWACYDVDDIYSTIEFHLPSVTSPSPGLYLPFPFQLTFPRLP